MITPKVLPVRPSLESLRKQAKKLAREIVAGNSAAIARARSQLPNIELPLSQRDAQRVLAREYGFAGWQDLREEVRKRVGQGLEVAGEQARRAVHDNDIDRLKELLARYPALVSWSGGSLFDAASPFSDCFEPEREQNYVRVACAELLIDAGAAVDPSVWMGVIDARARGMLQLLWRKGMLPRTLKVLVALGDLEGVRECFDASGALCAGSGSTDERTAVHDAFICACRFQHRAIASMLLERCIALDHDLGRRVDGGAGRDAFLAYVCGDPHRLDGTAVASGSPWQAFVMDQVLRAISDNDLPEFTRLLESESWLLGEAYVSPQVDMLERAAFTDRGAFMAHLLDLDPAILHCPTPPRSSAIVFALEYGHAHLVPLLTRIWPVPDDLPHAVGVGDFARVKRWFDAAGQPTLGNPEHHYPGNDPGVRKNLGIGSATVQQILDVALAWACMNRQLDIASFLLDHGADINTRWSTHEPASILHECALHNNYEAAKFLIDHGIDMTIRDHRWGGTAEGWARYAAQNEAMADFLAAAAQRKQNE